MVLLRDEQKKEHDFKFNASQFTAFMEKREEEGKERERASFEATE